MCDMTYMCTCRGEGWVVGIDQQKCHPCPHSCQGDPCLSHRNPRNKCVPLGRTPILLQASESAPSITKKGIAGNTQTFSGMSGTFTGGGSLWEQYYAMNPSERSADSSLPGGLRRLLQIGKSAINEEPISRNQVAIAVAPGSIGYPLPSMVNPGMSFPLSPNSNIGTPNMATGGTPTFPWGGMQEATFTGTGGYVEVNSGTFPLKNTGFYTQGMQPGTFPLPGTGNQNMYVTGNPQYAQAWTGVQKKPVDTDIYSEVNNFIVPGVDYSTCPSYRCECEGSNWITPPTARTCLECVNPCSNADPCNHRADSLNTCSPKVTRQFNYQVGTAWLRSECEAFVCECNGKGYVTPTDGQSCQLCANPCSNDPCSSGMDGRNRCVAATAIGFGNNRCGEYRCECGAEGFIAGLEARSCQRCANPCEFGDPCKSAAGSCNKCVPDFANSLPDPSRPGQCTAKFTCRCECDGFLVSAGQSTCEYCPNRCTSDKDPCGARANPFNKCRFKGLVGGTMMRSYDSEYFGNPDFLPSDAATTDGTFFIGNEWEIPQPMQGASAYANPEGQPGSFDYNFDSPRPNDFDMRPDPFNPYAVASSNVYSISPMCGGYSCECRGNGWVAKGVDQYCEVCANPCDPIRDPCLSRMDKRNKCVSTPPPMGDCSRGYTCECDGRGFITPAGAQTCQNCPNACLNGDPCMSNSDLRNKCVPITKSNGLFTICGGFSCECDAPGWITPVGAGSCQSCEDPCLQGDPCRTKLDNRNTCMLEPRNSNGDAFQGGKCAGYICRCNAPGFVSNERGQYCTASCPDPCSNGDPCNQRRDNRNRY
jgi:hypothetical protein